MFDILEHSQIFSIFLIEILKYGLAFTILDFLNIHHCFGVFVGCFDVWLIISDFLKILQMVGFEILKDFWNFVWEFINVYLDSG